MNLALVAVNATVFTSFEDVQIYAKDVGLPDSYRTADQMLNIANYVLQRENVTKGSDGQTDWR